MLLKRGPENRMERNAKRNKTENMQCDIHILSKYMYTLSVCESTLFSTDDEDILNIHHKVKGKGNRNKYGVCFQSQKCCRLDGHECLILVFAFLA